VLFGAYMPPAPEAGTAEIDALEGALQRPVEIVLWYQHWAGWGRAFHPEWVERAATGGRIPLLTWEPWAPGPAQQPDFRLSRIADGAFDSYIEQWAHAIRKYGKELYLRPMHEMNAPWYPWGGNVNGNSPEEYVRAWRHLHDVFTMAGATNVRWVWSPQAGDVPSTPANALESYYPGAEYVDVLALDGFNWGGSTAARGGWRSFGEIFGAAYDRIVPLGPQPLWIAETASDAFGGDKAAWVRDMFASLPRYPRIRAVVWFHALKERDWRATSSPEVAAAFSLRRGGPLPI
jgi:beta-mannanase